MQTKHKLIFLGVVVLLIIFLEFMLSGSASFVAAYSNIIYYPFQSCRNIVFSLIPFSFGDIVYLLGGIALLITIARWIYFISKLRLHYQRLGSSLLSFLCVTAFILLFFILGWGGNYYRVPLPQYWQLQNKLSKKDDSAALVAFNQLLITRLNTTAPLYRNLPFKEINNLSLAWYRAFTDSKIKTGGFNIKASFFGFLLEHIGIDGYYNPFTGEGQVNKNLPGFVLPFVISHEMAHQAGIGSEEDANLLAYVLGTMTDDPTFNYSASLNLWLYTNSRLFRKDSALAKKMERLLNPLTLAHLDTLEMLSKKYNNPAARYSSEMYDGYLKMNRQKDGLKSYSNVALSARLWEDKAGKTNKKLIKIP